ncbi:hypothetical protein [Polymorphospora rubra]
MLLTRAMKGMVVYSTDPATRAMLKQIVNPPRPTTGVTESEPQDQ